MMRSFVTALLISVGIVACASNTSISPTASFKVPQRGSRTSNSTTVPISAGGGSFTLPQYDHFRGNVTYAANDAPSGATLTLTNSGTSNPANAPAPPSGTPILYLEASIGGGASEVTFSTGSTTMSLSSDVFQSGGTYQIEAYEGSRLESSVAGTLKNITLKFQTPLSGVMVTNATPLVVEVVQLSAGTPPPSPSPDWDSFGYDLARSGYDPAKSPIGVGNVGSLQSVWSFNVGSKLVHEPVYASGVNVNGQTTNVLYAGSQYGSTMYAINAATSAIIWQDAVPDATFTCDSQLLRFSIGETPAIDRAKNLLYFADGHNQVHAVDLATGKEATGWPLTVADYTPDHNFMHGGLTYNAANGLLYAVTGSTCDISPWYGRVVAINTKEPSIIGTFYTISGGPIRGGGGGGIWGPGGASVDTVSNRVFVASGNADTKTGEAQNAGDAEEVIELSANLHILLAHNYPANIPVIPGDNDFDFGATPLLFHPRSCPAMVAAMNKSGTFELYDRSSISNGPIEYMYMSVPTNIADFIGVPAYDPVTGYVYIGLPTSEGIYQPGLAAFSIQSNCTLNPTPTWSASFGPTGGPSGPPSRRSPISIANGVVYISNYTGDQEFAFNAATGAQLWTTKLSSSGSVGTVIANGMVFVGADDGTITAWALPDDAKRLRKRVHKTKHSIVPVHRSAPLTPWAPWN